MDNCKRILSLVGYLGNILINKYLLDLTIDDFNLRILNLNKKQTFYNIGIHHQINLLKQRIFKIIKIIFYRYRINILYTNFYKRC